MTYRFATIQNVTDRRQTTHCTKGLTDSTVGQKPWVRPVWRRTPLFYVTILAILCIKGITAVQLNIHVRLVDADVDATRRLNYASALHTGTSISAHWRRFVPNAAMPGPLNLPHSFRFPLFPHSTLFLPVAIKRPMKYS